MPDQKPPSGVFVTKDDFYQEMKEMRKERETATLSLMRKQTRVEEKIIGELRRVSREWKTECTDDVKSVNIRVDKLESKVQRDNIVATAIGSVTAIIISWLTRIGA